MKSHFHFLCGCFRCWGFGFLPALLVSFLAVPLVSAENASSSQISADGERRALPPADEAPEDWTRIPFFESRPEFQPTEAETRRGFALFTRPLVDAIYPESRPGADERVEKLSFFAAGNQFQTLNFAVYPLQALPELRVKAGQFQLVTDESAVFPSENVQVRLVTYRGIRYPQYSSKSKQFRVLPEYLQDVTINDAPAFEPQRYFVTFRVPAGMKPGVYSGKITVAWGENSNQFSGEKSAVLPVELKVLGFDLQSDPSKHYSAYYYPPKDAEGNWDQPRMEREFAAMRDYGFTRSPVYCMSYDAEQKKLFFPHLDFWLSLMKKNDLQGPIPVIGGGGTWLAAHDYGAEFGSHIQVRTPPREEFYAEMNRLCRQLKKDVDALPAGTPEMVFGPLDETSPEATEFGTRVYRAYHDAGLVTYTTKEPKDPTFKAYDDVVDVYASQVFNPPYDEVMTRHKREYWCYPNHNSYERKDLVIMAKGGRMTYGFGFWRSGFDLLIPWIWRASSPKHFDEKTSSGANLLHPETGEVIMTTYWECFREGISDLRYLFTLENYVVQREGSNDPKLNEEIRLSRELLQEIWDSIVVQEKYLNRNLWESARFDQYRTRLAERIDALSKFAPLNSKTAPSVIIEPRVIERSDPFQEECERRDAEGSFEKVTVSPDSCVASEAEAKVEVLEGADVPAGARNSRCALLTVTIDKKHDGSSGNGLYLSNWPALAGYVSEKAYEKTGMKMPLGVLLRLYVDSNRTEKADVTPIHVGVQPGGYSFDVNPNLKAKTWHTVFVPLQNAGYEGMPPVSGLPRSIRLTISEQNHDDGDVLKIYFDEISFVR